MAAPDPDGLADRATLSAFLTIALLGGLNTVAVHQVVLELTPIWGASSRFLIAGLLMAAVVVVGRRPIPRGRSLWGALAYGLVGFAAFYALAYTALVDVPAGTAGVLLALSPLATFALAIVQRQERFRVEGLVGAVVAIAGVAVVFIDRAGAAVPLGPLLMFIGAVVCLAEANVIAKWLPQSDPFATNAIAMLASGAVLFALALGLGERPSLPAQPATWLAFVYVIVLGSVALFALYLFAIERWPASRVSYATLLMPVVAVAASGLLTGEQFSPSFALGGLLILAGVYIGAFLAHRPRRSTATAMPECLPVDDCADAIPAALRSAGSVER